MSHNPNVKTIYGMSKEPTGFPNRTDTSLSFDDSTRTLTLTPVSGSFEYYVQGVKYTYLSAASAAITDTEGLWYFYFDGYTLQRTQTFSEDIIVSYAIVSIVYWDAGNNKAIYVADERHGMTMDGRTHVLLHNSVGAAFINGFALSDFNVDGAGNSAIHGQFSVGNGIFYDEDIKHTISDGAPQELAPISQLPVFFREGTGGNWRSKTADNFPIVYSGTAGYTGAGGRLPYNQWTGSAWQFTELTSGNFVLVHIFATNDIAHPVIAIQGINEYNNITAARAGATTEIASLSGLPFAESVVIGTVIYQTSNSCTNAIKGKIVSTDTGANYVDLRRTTSLPINQINDHGNLSGLGDPDHPASAITVNTSGFVSGNLSSSDDDVQTALNTVHGLSIANRTLSNLASTSINTSLIPSTDLASDIGSASKRWGDGYFGPASLHLVSKTGESISPSDWAIGIDSLSDNLTISESGVEKFNLSKAGHLAAASFGIQGGGSLVGGSGQANRVAYWTDSTSISGSQALTFDGSILDIGATIHSSGNVALSYSTGTTGVGLGIQTATGIVGPVDADFFVRTTNDSAIILEYSSSLPTNTAQAIVDTDGYVVVAYGQNTFNTIITLALNGCTNIVNASENQDSLLMPNSGQYIGNTTGAGPQHASSLFSVGSNEGFRVDSNGNIVYLNGLPISFPSSFGSAGSVLTNDGSNHLTWTVPTGVTSISLAQGTTGLTFSTDSGNNFGSPKTITTSGTFTLGGTLSVANGGTGTSTAFTQGSIIFAGLGGTYSQNSGNFIWDNTNRRLGIGIIPTGTLHVDAGAASAGAAGSSITLTAQGGGTGNTNGGNVLLQGGTSSGTGTAGSVIVRPGTNSTTAFQVQNATSTPILSVDTTNSQTIITSGSVTAPALAFRNSTNTGIYSPTTSQIAISAGGVQGILATSSAVTITPSTTIQGVSVGKVASGSSCVAIGGLSILTTGANNTGIGNGAGSNITSGQNITCIGAGAQPSRGDILANNEFTLGSGVTSLRCGTGTITVISDQRDKADIQDLSLGLDFLNTVRPVQFKWDRRDWYDDGISDGSKKQESFEAGFIAQELDSAQVSANAEWMSLAYKTNPDRLEATPMRLFPVVVKACQELAAKAEAAEARADSAEARIAALEAAILALTSQ